MVVHKIITSPYPEGGACKAKHYYNSSGPHSNPGPHLTMELISDISKAINGEFEAIHCYEYLINQTTDSGIKKQLIEIRNDEIRHYQTFTSIYTSLTHQQPSPQLTKQCPTNYHSGIHAAFIDEQDTVDFYHEIARSTNDPFIKEQFISAASDEQNHAVWFLYFMNHH